MKRKLICWLPLLLLIGCSQPTYRTTSLTPDKRAELLLKELTLEEKVALMMDTSQPVERLGIKPYNWWNEALHGVARAGLATVFPQPIGMAASFSPQTVYMKYSMPYRMRRVQKIHITHRRAVMSVIRDLPCGRLR